MITVVYAFRNRDLLRVKATLDSLSNQSFRDFDVIFVNYGSEMNLSNELENLIKDYPFVNYFYVGHKGLLWNKSKALNFGIKNAASGHVLISDIDIVFPPDVMEYFSTILNPDKFYLFRIGYLTEAGTKKYYETRDFRECEVGHEGYTYGVGLFPKKGLEKVHGLDEFFHFYGSEDEDLNLRLENSGFIPVKLENILLFHLWHVTFSSSKDSEMSRKPLVYNIKRINQQHYFFNKNNNAIIPNNQETYGNVIKKNELEELSAPTKSFNLPNIRALVHHFFYVQLESFKGEIVKVTLEEDNYYRSLKHSVKKILGKQTQPYISMKEVNDIVLTEILYHYRNHNYAFEISDDLKKIIFIIKL